MSGKLLDQDILFGGDLIIQVGDQLACHSSCLAHAKEKLNGLKQINVKLLRKGLLVDLLIDTSTLPSFVLE